uniref:Uncharacterized protein n=1 Tax=Myotis myotis TaxID=51298 RepID=A0A7J7VZE4_MYOMY|nr:hypothetical protein mMyoMyo1_012386 [Myotis myotis]
MGAAPGTAEMGPVCSAGGRGAPTQRSVGKSQERCLRVLPPCEHLELLHAPPGRAPRFQPPPSLSFPNPSPPLGASKAGARPGSRLVGLGLLRPAFINPPQEWCPRKRDPSRKACPPPPGMGTCSASVLTCSWESMSLAGPVPRPPRTHLEGQQWAPSPGLCCVDSSHRPTLSVWVTRVPRGDQ